MLRESPTWGGVMRPDPEFLARATPEAALDPARPILDAHMHLWRLFPEAPYLVEDYAADIRDSGHRVTGAIHVECSNAYRPDGPEFLRPLGETEFIAAEAARAAAAALPGRPRAIVGHADLRLGAAVEEVLEAHETAAKGLFRGIRQRAKWDADPAVRGKWSEPEPGLYLRPDFNEGLSRLAAMGHVFDASIFHPQIPDVTALARAHPDARIVVVHSASPLGHGPYAARRAEVHAEWRALMAELATCENVSIKLGGVLMNVADWDFSTAPAPLCSEALATRWRPWIEPCVELFGAERCMVSSNFPVEKAGLTMGVIWNMFKRVLGPCSEDEKRLLFHDAAARTYRIGGRS